MAKQTQADKILEHLQTRGKLRPLQALKEYGTNRLAARINELRNRGHQIETRLVDVASRDGTIVRVAEYSLRTWK